MKTTTIIKLFGFIALVAMIGLGSIACDGGGGHTHQYGAEWKSDATHHWHECTAGDGEKADLAEHTVSAWTQTKAASILAEGEESGTCTVCDGTATQAIARIVATSIDDIADYLASADGGDDADDPIALIVKGDLGDGSDEGSGWRELLAAIDDAGKYVSLDLSDCILTEGTFNTGITVEGLLTGVKPDGMDNIVSIALPDGITNIGDYAFSGCTSLVSIDIPADVTSIGMLAFYGCTGLTSIDLPAGVTSIGMLAFYGCTGLTSIDLPAGVTTIGEGAFTGCTGLTSFTVDPGNQNYISQDGILYDKPTTQIVQVPTAISGSVTIPDSVTSISDLAFIDCTSLTSVTIPASVTSISDFAFYGCTGLTSVTFEGADTDITASSCFPNLASLRTAYTAGGIGTYTRNNSIVPIPDTVEWVKQD